MIETVKEHYRLQYFGAVELAKTSIKDRFDQSGYVVYRNLESHYFREWMATKLGSEKG